MDVEYLEDGDIALFNGLKYRRDKKSGYYLNSTIRQRLHRAVWTFYNGPIQKGFHVHHINEDKGCNEIWNLELMQASKHAALHGKERDEREHETMKENLRINAIPKAAEWHKSDIGKRWHSEHAKEVAKNLRPTEHICLHCGKQFLSRHQGRVKFCSNVCKSAYRRESGFDDETRTCDCCGSSFTTSKYSKGKTCSPKCRNILRWRESCARDRAG